MSDTMNENVKNVQFNFRIDPKSTKVIETRRAITGLSKAEFAKRAMLIASLEEIKNYKEAKVQA